MFPRYLVGLHSCTPITSPECCMLLNLYRRSKKKGTLYRIGILVQISTKRLNDKITSKFTSTHKHGRIKRKISSWIFMTVRYKESDHRQQCYWTSSVGIAPECLMCISETEFHEKYVKCNDLLRSMLLWSTGITIHFFHSRTTPQTSPLRVT